MVGEKSSVQTSQNELLRRAVGVLRTRYRCGSGYSGLSSSAAAELSEVLEIMATATGRPDGTDRDEAIALAHRLVDDDQPELSPLWPRPSS